MQISEYVSIGHPDKIADYISEYILDRLIEQDKRTRYALEVQIKDNFVTLGGEVTTNAQTDYDKWVKQAIADIGYTHEYALKWGKENTLDCDDIRVEKHISQQSNDIALGVNTDAWGDQGIMFGMAVNEPETDYMTKDYYLAKMLGQALYESGLGGLDIKTLIALDKGEVQKVVVAIPLISDTKAVEDFVRDKIKGNYELIINGTGRYVKHSSMGDCGTTGRKLAVDFYGGNCNVGGGCPWTKDGTKADLTLNLYARKKALDYVKEHNVPQAKCGIACCIGKKEIEVTIWDEHNNEVESYRESKYPSELIKTFALDKPIYAKMCKEGLFENIK